MHPQVPQTSEELNPISENNAQQCISETQLNCNVDNKGPAYFAMFARVGLDNPTKSIDSRDNINQSGDSQEVYGRINTLQKTS